MDYSSNIMENLAYSPTRPQLCEEEETKFPLTPVTAPTLIEELDDHFRDQENKSKSHFNSRDITIYMTNKNYVLLPSPLLSKMVMQLMIDVGLMRMKKKNNSLFISNSNI